MFWDWQKAVNRSATYKANQMQVILSLRNRIRWYSHKWSRAELLLHVCVTVSSWVHDSLNSMRKSKASFCCCYITLCGATFLQSMGATCNVSWLIQRIQNPEHQHHHQQPTSCTHLFTLFCEHSRLFVYFVGERALKKGNCQKKATWCTMHPL